MMHLFIIITQERLMSVSLSNTANADDLKIDPKTQSILTLTYGRVVIKLMPDIAPQHVERIKKTLTREGFTTV